MASSQIPRHIVLTGTPGVGKTTLIHKTCEALRSQGISIQGFYTEEIRQHGRRTGFDVVTLDGKRAPLARVDDSDIPTSRQYRVGQYSVQLQSFEACALPVISLGSSKPLPVIVIDEVGKMEMFSSNFARSVKSVLNAKNTTFIGTIPVPKGRPIPLVEEIRNRSDARVFTVTRENRNSLLEEIVQTTIASYQQYSKS